MANTGFFRRYILRKNEVRSSGFTYTLITQEYSLLTGFTYVDINNVSTTYPEITEQDLSYMTNAEYGQRLVDFLGFLNINLSDQSILITGSTGYDPVLCPLPIPTTTTTTSGTTTTTTTVPTTTTTTTTFSTKFNSFVLDVFVDSNGNILSGGNFTTYNAQNTNKFAKISNIGAYQELVGSEISGTHVREIAEVESNKYLIGGNFFAYDGNTANYIVRTLSDGTYDPTFNSGTGFDGTTLCEVIRILYSGNTYLIGGVFTEYNGVTISQSIVRLFDDGSIDTSFDANLGLGNGGSDAENIRDIVVTQDGKYLIVGQFDTYYDDVTICNGVVKVNIDGTIDGTFNLGGFTVSGPFGNNIGNRVVVTTDNKYLIGGQFEEYDSVSCNNLVRLDSNGNIDQTYDVTGTGVYCVIQLSTGDYLIGGEFTAIDTVSANNIARITPTGTVTDFTVGSGFNGVIFDIKEDSDGNYVIVGAFTEYNGNSHERLIVLEPNGNVVF